MTLYILQNEEIRKSAIKELKAAPLGSNVKFSTKPCPRSIQQNNTFHMWCEDMSKSGEIKDDTGGALCPEQVKHTLKKHYVKKETWKDKRGREYVMPVSTAKLTKSEFSELLAKCQITASYYNINLREPSLYGLEIYEKTLQTTKQVL